MTTPTTGPSTRARAAAWAVEVLSGWINRLSEHAQPAWDAAYDEDVERWEESERAADVAYDEALRDAYSDGLPRRRSGMERTVMVTPTTGPDELRERLAIWNRETRKAQDCGYCGGYGDRHAMECPVRKLHDIATAALASEGVGERAKPDAVVTYSPSVCGKTDDRVVERPIYLPGSGGYQQWLHDTDDGRRRFVPIWIGRTPPSHPAPEPERCVFSGNPVGTDTWGNGMECKCEPCQRWLVASREAERPQTVIDIDAADARREAEREGEAPDPEDALKFAEGVAAGLRAQASKADSPAFAEQLREAAWVVDRLAERAVGTPAQKVAGILWRRWNDWPNVERPDVLINDTRGLLLYVATRHPEASPTEREARTQHAETCPVSYQYGTCNCGYSASRQKRGG